MELREFVRNWLSEGKEVLVKMPEVTNDETDQKNPDRPKLKKYKKSDFDAQINELLEKYVKPAVENDGGAIEFWVLKKVLLRFYLKERVLVAHLLQQL